MKVIGGEATWAAQLTKNDVPIFFPYFVCSDLMRYFCMTWNNNRTNMNDSSYTTNGFSLCYSQCNSYRFYWIISGRSWNDFIHPINLYLIKHWVTGYNVYELLECGGGRGGNDQNGEGTMNCTSTLALDFWLLQWR